MKRADGQKLRRTTPEEISFIREHWATMTCVEIESAIGVTKTAVKSIASRLGLRKPMSTISAIRKAVRGHGSTRNTPRDMKRRIERKRRRAPLAFAAAPVELPAIATRVHRIYDDEELPHGR